MADDGHAAGVPSDERKAAMIASVEKIIADRCKQFVRRSPGSHPDPSAAEDAAQACRLALWEVADRFDPAGPAKWSTFAYAAIGHALARFRDEAYGSTLRGRCVAVGHDIDFKAAAPADPDDDGIDPDELDTVERSLTGVRRAMFGHLLEALTPAQRELVDAVVFRGLTLSRVALQRGQKLDIVEKNFRGVFRRLLAKGLLTDDQAAAFGVTIRTPAPSKKWAAGERERFHDAVRSGKPAKEIADEFGVSVSRVTSNRRKIRAALTHVAARQRHAKAK